MGAPASTPGDPGAAAIDFLMKVREGKVNLEPGGDTALSSQTAEDKRREIARRLARMTNDLRSGTLEVGAVKQDENVAAVLVRKIGGFDPARLQVFPVALVRRGTAWAAAPVPASFENSGLGYAESLRQRLESLETWMLREQVLDLAKLRDQSVERMRTEIRKNLPLEDYRKFTPLEVGNGFLEACENGDSAAMLGYMGGLQESLPHNWPARLRAADNAAAPGKNATHPWRLLTSRQVVRVIVHHENAGDSGLVSVACLDPADSSNGRIPQLRIVHLDMEKNRDGTWQLNLPGFFLNGEPQDEEEEFADEELDADLLEAFPKNLREKYPARNVPEARAAFDATMEAMHAPDPAVLLSLIETGEDHTTALRACGRAAHNWWPVQDQTSVRHPLPLAFRESGSSAVGIVQFLSLNEPDRTRLRTFHFRKSESGWLWQAGLTSDHAADGSSRELQEWAAGELANWKDRWQQALFPRIVTGAEIAAGPAPTEEQARETVSNWLAASRATDLAAALPLAVCLDDPGSASRALRNLGYEVKTGRLTASAPEIQNIAQGKSWTLVRVRVNREEGPVFPVYPVIATADGPKIPLEIDLFAEGNRSRAFLNNTSFERAGLLTSAELETELRELFRELEKDLPAER